MNKCPSCGYTQNKDAIKCTQCGHYFSKVMEIISAEEAEEELLTFNGQCKRILKSGNIKAELLAEYKKFRAGLSRKGVFTLYVILAFVFLLTLSVL
ncbi:hypothetical protein [Crenothrix sp.]|uniref:hypothetical protein n=1 Tax=Crenothrix sp. TaxID=3100433 RepID=UPI00374C8D15